MLSAQPIISSAQLYVVHNQDERYSKTRRMVSVKETKDTQQPNHEPCRRPECEVLRVGLEQTAHRWTQLLGRRSLLSSAHSLNFADD